MSTLGADCGDRGLYVLPMIHVLSLVVCSPAVTAPDPEPGGAPDEAPAEEITVWGEAVEAARQEVVARIVDLGYDKRKARDGRTVFKQDLGWKGLTAAPKTGSLRE